MQAKPTMSAETSNHERKWIAWRNKMQLINFLIWSCISILLIGHIRESMRGRLSVRMSLWSRMAYHSSTTLLLFVVDDKCMLLRWWSNLYWWLWNLLPRRVRWDTNLHINPINDVIRQTVKFPIRFIFFYGLSPVASDILPSRARCDRITEYNSVCEILTDISGCLTNVNLFLI